MGIVLTNATLVDLDPPRVETGGLRIAGGFIVDRGNVAPQAGDETIDCAGCIVLPGFVNGHTHLYSALAVGMPAPQEPPRNFLEILQRIWWRLDQALDSETIETSAQIGALEALRCGTTTLIDHHASPNHIEGSLDLVERGISAAGLRGILCYEVTNRHGKSGAESGLEENRRYIVKTQKQRAGQFAALSGAHASFTCDDMSLQSVDGWRDEFGVGVHIHVAEDPCDDRISRQRYGKGAIERIFSAGLVRSSSILAHCIHLTDADIDAINLDGPTIAHNPRSNMNNAVGYTPIEKLKCPIMLGTDGIGADMLAEAKAAWFKSRDAQAGISPARVIEMLATGARRASASLGVTLGKLTIGAAADIVITDHQPPTPLNGDNLAAHLIFRIDSRHVRHVLVDGKVRLRDRVIVDCDEAELARRSSLIAQALWKRMEKIGAS